MSKRKPRRKETVYLVELDGASRHAICVALDLLHFTRDPSSADLALADALTARIEPLISAPGFPELSFRKLELKLIVSCLELSLRYLGGEDLLHPLSGFADTILPGELSALAPAFGVIHSGLSGLL